MTINSTTRKTNPFTGNGSAHTFPFTFKVFTDADIVVKKLEASTSIETTLTLGLNNDYIVTLNADQNSNPGGSVTLKSGGNNQTLANGFSLVITSDVEALQGTDLTNQGGFFPEVINDALDKAIIIHQQQQTELDRSIRFSLTNSIGSLEITENATARANKVLGFDNLGEFNVVQELGTFRGNWTAGRAYVVRDIVKDTSTNNIFFCNTAHTSSGSQPLTTNTNSANWDLIVDAATATTSSTNAASSATAAANSATAAANSATAAASSQTAAASSATTASTKATQADTAKTAAQTAQTAAETAKTAAETALDSFDDRYLGAKSSNPTLDNDGNALIDGALYFNTTVNRMRVYDLGNTTWLEVTISGSDLTNTNTVAGAISNVNAVGGNISNVNAVASNATNINAVNSNSSNINTVAGAASNINTVSGSIANVNTVGGGIANVNTVAAEINNNKLQTVANNINSVVTAANDLNEATSEIDTVANNIANVNNVGNNISNVNSVAGIASNITAVAGNASNVNTVAGAITNVNNVGGSIANVNTVASNLSGVNSFAERYRTDNSGNNPSTSLNAGDLFYNQLSGKLLVYNGQTSAWEETQSVGNFFINTISSFSGTGGNSATFNGSAYKFTLSNAGQFAQQMLVSINGVVQKPNTGTSQPSEGFAIDGANIIFAAAPPTGADFFIVTIGASVSIGTPSDNTVTSAKIVDGTIVGSDLATNIDLVDNQKIRFGTGNDLEIYHNGSQNYINTSNGSIELRHTVGGADEPMIKAYPNGQVQLMYNGATKLDTTSTGISVTGEIVASGGVNFGGGKASINVNSNVMDFVDNFALRLGNSQDLAIFHDGTHSNINNITGDLVLSSPNTIAIKSSGGSENMITAANNGAVELFHGMSSSAAEKKLETTSTGAKVTGDLEVTGGITSTSRTNRNLIINGAMTVAQRGTSSTTAGYETVDRFVYGWSGTDESPTQAQADVASGTTPYSLGFRKSYKITNGNQTSGAGAGDYVRFYHVIESQNIASSGWNYVSSSSNITLSFWIKSSVAQNFYGYLLTQDGSAQMYPYETGSLSANTWTKVTKTIPGNSNLQFDNDANQGFYFFLWPFAGTNFTNNSATNDAWGGYNGAARMKDATSTWYTTNDATLEITGMQLEVGSVATDFEHEPYCDTVRKCLRYYYATKGDGTLGGVNNYASGIFGFGLNGNIVGGGFRFPEPMRAAPSLTLIRPSDGAVNGSHLFRGVTGSNSGTDKSANTVNFVDVGRYSYMYMIYTGGDSVVQGGGYLYHIIADAEL